MTEVQEAKRVAKAREVLILDWKKKRDGSGSAGDCWNNRGKLENVCGRLVGHE